jgi:hypothetical protein
MFMPAKPSNRLCPTYCKLDANPVFRRVKMRMAPQTKGIQAKITPAEPPGAWVPGLNPTFV